MTELMKSQPTPTRARSTRACGGTPWAIARRLAGRMAWSAFVPSDEFRVDIRARVFALGEDR